MDTFSSSFFNNIYIELNGKKLASVDGFKVQILCDSNYIESMGESNPIATIKGKTRYKINISKMCFFDEISFDSLNDFNLIIVKNNTRVTYKNCQITEVKEFSNDGLIMEDITLISQSKVEENGD